MKLPVYLDHAATTPVAPEVLDAMAPFLSEVPYNEAAIHSGGRQARHAVEEARAQVAALIGADMDEVFFTSGGTEANNWALKAVAGAAATAEREVLVSAVEHAAVMESADALARGGCRTVRVPVTGSGRVQLEAAEARMSPKTAIVSVMGANNETGVVQPVAEVAAMCAPRRIALHCDLVQYAAHLPVCVRDLGADLATISAHKMYGPKGAGALYVRRGTLLGRWMDGGSQERGLRAGTVNVPAVVGFGAACALLAGRREEDAERLGSMRDRFEAQIQARIPECRISGGDVQRLPGTSHVCLRGVEAEALLIGLDADGVYASGGAACSARSVVTSHVMRAMGIEDEWARGAVRFSMGRETTDEQLDYAVDALENALDDLRR